MKKIGLVIAILSVITLTGCTGDVGMNTNRTNSDCSSNKYNCSNFDTHNEAQALFEACGGVQNDVHQLDRDGDGLACETLP